MEEEAQAEQGSGEFAGLPEAAETNDKQGANDSASGSNGAADQQRPAYQSRVDLDSLPEDIRKPVEARFKHLSWVMKKNETKINEWQDLAAEQSKRIEELTNGFAGMATQMQDKSFADAEASLRQQSRIAFEAGDNDKYLELQDKLADLRLEKKIASMEKKPASRQERPAAPIEVDDADISPEIKSWQEEADEAGQQIRPWAQPADHGYRQAYAELLAIKTNPRMSHYTESQIMQELDKRMGVTRAASRQQVMGSNLTRGSKTAKLSLNPKQEEVAVRMKLGGPKASRDLHIEAYRKQLAEIKGTRQ